MEPVTTPIRQLSERLLQFHVSQQSVLQALRAFNAEATNDPVQASTVEGIDTCEAAREFAASLGDPGVHVEAGVDPTACAFDPLGEDHLPAVVVSCEESAPLACDEPLLSTLTVMPGCAPEFAGLTNSDSDPVGCSEEAQPALIGGAELGARPLVRTPPAHSLKSRASGRSRRDYNYFADLEAKLAQLSVD